MIATIVILALDLLTLNVDVVEIPTTEIHQEQCIAQGSVAIGKWRHKNPLAEVVVWECESDPSKENA